MQLNLDSPKKHNTQSVSTLTTDSRLQTKIKAEISAGLTLLLVYNPHIQECLGFLSVPSDTINKIVIDKEEISFLMIDDHTFLIYKGMDPRLIRICMVVAQETVAYHPAEEVVTIIENQYWKMRETGHKLQLGQDSKVRIISSMYSTNRIVDNLQYLRANQAVSLLQTLPAHKSSTLSLLDICTLIEEMQENEYFKEENFYADVLNYTELKVLTNQQHRMQEFIEFQQTQIPSTLTGQKTQDKCMSDLRKRRMLDQLLLTEQREVAIQKKYQNMEGLPLEALQAQHLELANQKTVSHWIFAIQSRLHKAFSEISSHKDKKTEIAFHDLYGFLSAKIELLNGNTQLTAQALQKLKRLRDALDKVYSYQKGVLNRELIQTVRYYLNEWRYKLVKKKDAWQKLLIIALVLLLIEMISDNNLLTLTLAVIFGALYIR